MVAQYSGVTSFEDVDAVPAVQVAEVEVEVVEVVEETVEEETAEEEAVEEETVEEETVEKETTDEKVEEETTEKEVEDEPTEKEVIDEELVEEEETSEDTTEKEEVVEPKPIVKKPIVKKMTKAQKQKAKMKKMKEIVANKLAKLAKVMGEAQSLKDQQALQAQISALINYVPGFSQYGKLVLPGADMYISEDIYRNQKTPPPGRGLLNGLASQILHEKMVDQQYKE